MTTRAPAARRLAVPFFDLGPAHEAIRDDLVADFAGLLDSGAFANGPAVAELEEAFASYCGRRLCVGVASGLDALRLALIAGGLEPGDEVIAPAQTFVATIEAIAQAGGTPVLVDVSEADYCIDPAAAEAAVTEATRFLIPVDLYGQAADLSRLEALAERHGLALVEDACQAHGAARDGRRAGGAGLAAAFSFYPAKNLGALGDAGALVTDDARLAERVRSLREHGQRRKYEHEEPGWTSRLDTIHALALLRKLPLLDGWNEQRRRATRFYSEALAGVGDLRLPPVAPGSEPVWHLYVVRTERPDELGAFLRERGVASGRHYPEPIHLTRAYRELGHREGAFPVAEALARECLSLPIFPGIAEAQLEAVADAVREYFARGRSH